MSRKLSIAILVLTVMSVIVIKIYACLPENDPPVAVLNAVPSTAVVDVNVILDGSGSYDPDGSITKYEWDWTNDGTYDYNETSGSAGDGAFDGNTVHAYSSPGTYTAKLRVTDDGSIPPTKTDTDTCQVVIRYVTVPLDANTIQEAIDDAEDGDTIVVSEGSYYEVIDFNSKAITLTSSDPNDWEVVASTIIDANDPNEFVVAFENSEDSNSVITGFTITGGNLGIYCNGTSPTINNCVIKENGSGQDPGGGMYDCNSSSPAITNCFFIENDANYGGGIYDINSSPTLTSCVFSKNLASIDGGGMYDCNSSPTLINCTFNSNLAGGDGGGMYNSGSLSDPNLINCIFWGNDANSSGDEIYNDGSADPNFSFCDIEGCGGSGGGWDPNFGTDDGNNIDSAPCFVDSSTPAGLDAVFGTFDDGLIFNAASPCIDAANGSTASANDITGKGRIDVSYVENTGGGDPNYADMGAYEAIIIWFVDADANGNDDGTSWTDAYTDLQDALNDTNVAAGDQIWVADGNYFPTDGSDRSISFVLVEGVAVYGGFAGDETVLIDRDWVTNVTTLSGDIGTVDVNSDNSFRVVIGADGAIIDGFTITQGQADANSVVYGAGVYCHNTAITIANCVIKNNHAEAYGGGMSVYMTDSVIRNCIFAENSATAGYSARGGGLHIAFSSPTVINCLFVANTVSSIVEGEGGAIRNSSSSPTITNCTFRANSALLGGAIGNRGASSPVVTNSVFWGNSATSSGDEIYNYDEASDPNFSYCDIEGGINGSKCGGYDSIDGGGNIDSDPYFADANTPAGLDGVFGTLDDGLRLMDDSPCVDAADGNASYPVDIINLGRLDINDVNNTGVGVPDYVDIGAYESGYDTDSDGMPDGWEIRHGFDPSGCWDAYYDLDDDGLSNSQEYANDTDPNNADTDDDGITDGWEYYSYLDPLDPNDANEDLDNDGYSNFIEFLHSSDPNDANANLWNTTLYIPSHTTSIQQAINWSIDGDIIEVSLGTYYENIDFNDKAVTLTSVNPDNWDVVAATVIDPNNSDANIVTFDSGEDANSILIGLTLAGGNYGVYCVNSAPTISKCIVEYSNSHAIYIEGSFSPTITNSIIGFNIGDGVYSSSTNPPIIKNCLIYGNDNGIRFSGATSTALIRNNTIADNENAGIYKASGTDPNISNCILWSNDFNDLVGCNATYSCIEDVNDANGTGNITSDPCFVNYPDLFDMTTASGTTTTIKVADASLYEVNDVVEYDDDSVVRVVTDVNALDDIITFVNHPLDSNSTSGKYVYNWGTGVTDVNEDYNLDPNSLCISAGDPNPDPNYAGESDIDGELRVRGAYIDIGACEVPAVWYVDCNASGANDGSSWTDAFTSIQDAIDTANNNDGDTIIVAEGTYYESIDFDGKAVTLQSTSPNDPNVIATTIIDANDPNASVVTFDSGEDVESVLDGITITGGSVGIYLDNDTSPEITNCKIINNAGYGVDCNSGSPAISYCTINDNSNYGLRFSQSASADVNNCVIAKNFGGIGGGSPSVINCSIIYNLGYGVYSSTGLVKNTIIWGNIKSLYGCSATYSCIEGGNSGQGNINYMPYFEDANNNEYNLLSYSPCIDVGDPNSDYSNEPNDANNTCINMGAFGNTTEAALASADSDSDELPDTWELLYWPSVDSNDANDDIDGDDVNNLEEYHVGLDPNDSDSDDDGMDDGWELDYGLNPVDSSDGSWDADGDGLTNLQEYNAGTNPNDTDSDDDEITDGWENQYGLDPLDANDADSDLDSDGYSNITEFLHEGDPNDPNAELSNITLDVPSNTTSIQQAIDWSIDGDIIEVSRGIHYGTVNFNDRAITLTGTDPNDWQIVEATIIDANEANEAVLFDSREDANSVLIGLMITGGEYGVYCKNASSPTIARCIIEDSNSHGIRIEDASSPAINDSMIGLNVGDGIYVYDANSVPIIKNNWVYDNENGIAFIDANSASIVRNNTIVYNDSNGICVDSNTVPVISNCILWDNGDDLYNCSATYSCIKNGDSGTGNISSDPQFIYVSADDYRLQRTSPCINAGDPNGTYTNETDIEAEVRDANGVDMGADEICEVHNTTQNVWYGRIQDAIDDANDNDAIVAYEWTFYETIDFSDVNVMLTSTDPNNWTVTGVTIINANNSNVSVVTFDSGQDANSVLAGFTLTGGNYGVDCNNSSSPVIRNCFITDNNSIGIACVSGSPLITANKIGENNGDGIYSSSVTPPVVKNNWVYKNDNGIVLSNANTVATIYNNTIVFNDSNGIYVPSGNEPNVGNCILWGNDDDLNGCMANYSCIEDVNDANDPNSVGNISSDPLFIAADNDNYTIRSLSPCANAGDPNGSYIDEVDLYGNPRINGASVDQGATQSGYRIYVNQAGNTEPNIVIDNEDPSGRTREVGSTWTLIKPSTGWDGSHVEGSTGVTSYRFDFEAYGEYTVWVYWIPSASYTTNAKLRIKEGQEQTDITGLDQKNDPGIDGWHRINIAGETDTIFTFGGDVTLKLQHFGYDGILCADAIKLERPIDPGSSWQDPYGNLQEALDNALPGYEIWVAQGQEPYYPDVSAHVDDREASFELKGNVFIYGGFFGDETKLNQRNRFNYPTILSGDIGTVGYSDDNCYHVVTGADDATLDGFVIEGGNADFSGVDYRSGIGGGMLISVCSPRIENCTFRNNSAKNYGGGMAIWWQESQPYVNNCVFSNNESDDHDGGAIDIYIASADIVGCVFKGNNCGVDGGAISNLSIPSRKTKIVNGSFYQNVASRYGGAIYNIGSISSGSLTEITNCTFSENVAQGVAGSAMFNAYSGKETDPLTVINCSFSNNGEGTNAHSIYCYYDYLKLNNSILWGDGQYQLKGTTMTLDYINYNDIKGYSGGTGNNIDQNPQFAFPGIPAGNDDIFGTCDDGLMLQSGPCIDAGSNTAVPSDIDTDIIGFNRKIDGDAVPGAVVDMGAYEYSLISISPGAFNVQLGGTTVGLTMPLSITNNSNADIEFTIQVERSDP